MTKQTFIIVKMDKVGKEDQIHMLNITTKTGNVRFWAGQSAFSFKMVLGGTTTRKQANRLVEWYVEEKKMNVKPGDTVTI